MSVTPSIEVSFYRLSEALRPYFTALYLFEITGDAGAAIEDCLHPEWAVMRFTHGTPPIAAIGPGELTPQWPFVVSGPNSRSIRFRLVPARIWCLGLLPAGWARFAEARASAFADRAVDGMADPAFQVFAPILAMAQDSSAMPEAIARRIDAYLLAQRGRPSSHERLIAACHSALRDAEVANVAQLGEQLGLSARSLERFCGRYFGFPPKVLLRRQRLLRSLARFMLDPCHRWSQALDPQYHDQAQFVRDFRAFMGMTPSEYANTPHPIMDRIVAHRMVDQGVALPVGLSKALHYTHDLQARSE